MRLKAMTFNIHHAKGRNGKTDLGRIAAEIRLSGAEIVALQELDRFHPRSGFQDQLTRLARMLGMYHSFAPSINLGILQYGNGFLSKYPILSKQIIYMPGNQERRSILIIRFEKDGQRVTAANTHLGLFPKERRRQMALLLQELDRLERPAVLLGDFNMGEAHEWMKGLGGSWQKLKQANKESTIIYGGEIDHIFVNAKVRSYSAWVQKTTASDHNAVVADWIWQSGDRPIRNDK